MMFREASRVERLGKLPLTPHSTGSWPVSPVLISLRVCKCTRAHLSPAVYIKHALQGRTPILAQNTPLRPDSSARWTCSIRTWKLSELLQCEGAIVYVSAGLTFADQMFSTAAGRRRRRQ
jgi:hypothetical protein